jgi:hypothetical protein
VRKGQIKPPVWERDGVTERAAVMTEIAVENCSQAVAVQHTVEWGLRFCEFLMRYGAAAGWCESVVSGGKTRK